jgi:hypothetical protein
MRGLKQARISSHRTINLQPANRRGSMDAMLRGNLLKILPYDASAISARLTSLRPVAVADRLFAAMHKKTAEWQRDRQKPRRLKSRSRR